MVTTRSLLTLAVLTCSSAANAQEYTLRLVAQSGDAAPGSIGGHFTWLGWPTLNASGQVAFAGGSDGLIADTGLWRTNFDNPQALELIIGQDYPVPGSPEDVRFGEFDPSFHHPLLNDAGNVGFSARLTNLPDFQTGLFRMVNGSIQRVAVPGDVAPGTGGTLTYGAISNLPCFNASNSLGFAAALEGPGVNATNDRAYFAHWFGGVQMFLREGNAVPGMPGSTFSFGQSVHPTLENNGAISFAAAIQGASPASWSLWRGWPAAMEAIAVAGDPTPVGGVFTSSFGFDFWYATPGIGNYAFTSDVLLPIATLSGVWGSDDEGTDKYAVAEQPGPLGNYDTLADFAPQIAGDGTAAFWAGFQGGSEDTDSAIIRQPLGGVATVMVREGDAAEGFGPGVEFDQLAGSFAGRPQINDSHQIVLDAYVRGPGIDMDNDHGLWVIDADGSLHNILREGQWLSLDGGTPRQVQHWIASGGISEHGGRRPSINARGDVALVVYFTNGDSAVAVAQRPGPCASDLNNDGTVDAQDLGIMLGSWGDLGPVGTGGDVDWDGDTDGADLAVLLGAWGPCT